MSIINTPPRGGHIQGPVVGQYFGLFHGCSKSHFDTIVGNAPFDCCNLLILGFAGLWQQNHLNNFATLTNHRDNDFNGGQATADDTDEYRIRLVVDTARARNPNLKILISLGYYNEVVKASQTPGAFAFSLAELVDTYQLDGFDIDWEDNDPPIGDPFAPSDFVKLMQTVKAELGRSMDEPILTLCPAYLYRGSQDPQPDFHQTDKSVLECFTYVMPQAYDHGGNGTQVEPYAKILGDGTAKYDKILFGLSGEGYLDPPNVWMPDDPMPRVNAATQTGAAGIFSWRLDTDTLPKERPKGRDEGPDQLPKFCVAKKMWELMSGPYHE